MAGWGHRVTLLTSGYPGAAEVETLDGIEVYRTGGRYTLSAAAPRYYRRHFADRSFTAVVEDLNKIPFFAPLWAREPVVGLVHHLFGGVAFQEAAFPLALATWLLERPIPRVFGNRPCIAVSESTARDLVERGMRRSRITVIPNGIDLDRYRPLPGAEPFEEPSLLYLGRLKRYKRVDLLVRTVAVLRDRGVFVRLRIAGKGNRRPVLERLVERLDLSDRVTFEGFVSEERKIELLTRSWVHLLTSPKEGWGIANLEAAGCGTPTVASDSPGLRDSVVDGVTGFLVRHGDVEGIADRVERLVTDAGERATFGENARRFASMFTWERSARAVEAYLLDRVAGDPSQD